MGLIYDTPEKQQKLAAWLQANKPAPINALLTLAQHIHSCGDVDAIACHESLISLISRELQSPARAQAVGTVCPMCYSDTRQLQRIVMLYALPLPASSVESFYCFKQGEDCVCHQTDYVWTGKTECPICDRKRQSFGRTS